MGRSSSNGPPCFRAFGEPDVNAPRTYVIFGVPRGGTSVMGGLARMCGLYLGDDLPHNHEDSAFNVDLHRRDGLPALATIEQTIDRRNAEHAVWGWKYPRATRYLDDIRSRLRNPHLIVVFRDPVASSSRHVRGGKEPFDAVLTQNLSNASNLDLLARWEVPTLLVSYERVLARPIRTGVLLAEFLGTPPPPDGRKVREFVQPGSYKDV